MSEVIPEGWRLEPLASCIAESTAGEWGDEANGDENDIPVLRSTNFTDSGKIDYRNIVYRNIEERKRIKKALSKGDTLLEKSGGSPTQPVGRVVYFERDTPYLFSNFTQRLVAREGNDPKYVFYKLLSEYQNGTVLKFQQQTTGIINFQLAEYLTYETLLAPLPEQQKIATILSSVDDVIEKTRAQIDKLKDLKTGMMQELLTQGIGHTEFKDSPVGRIPEEWMTVGLNDLGTNHQHVLRTGPFGSSLKSDDFRTSGIPVINIQNLGIGRLERDSVYFITKEKAQELESYAVSKDDLVFSRVADVGRSVVIPDYAHGWIMSSNLMRISVDTSRIHPKYLMYQLVNGPAVTYQIKQVVADGGRPVITGSLIRSLIFPLPSIEEQFSIVQKIDSVDGYLTKTAVTLNQLINLKKALMQDLLTGKVRVKLDSSEVAAA